MEAQPDEGSVQPLESIPSTDVAATQNLTRINPKWESLDNTCAELFGPWDDLPRYAQINEPRLLRELDNAIVLFESRINHDDAGFHVWRERHKKAMEAGLAKIHRYPCLQTMVIDGKPIWHDEVWEQRYNYLIHQRQQIIMDRLARIKLPRYAREDFFGTKPAPHRALLHKRSSGRGTRPFKLRCDWWWPVEKLLGRAARRWDMDEATLKATFWETLPTPNVKTKASRAWGDKIKEEEEDAAERSTRKEKMEPPDDDKETVGLVAELVSEALFALG
ncbi:hypothetical protein BBK36DRAFT_1117033 [Trichoderma citrinoviride]|uniref:Uncharacterized protein n=1 Tax=Trichoderma citrinoviride TaxID=58853 RepID=A0A2T4BCP2_9HYPO|nr:hypothetical protein BBK36DRAFT_1117033 [Trichoderma citrinoviride]PTB67048.1 hypothetical protein BBK36DRAFT_1117033 [Trichoderma citrinoviride]